VLQRKSNIYSEYVFVALGIKHAMHITILSFVACPAVQYFPHYLISDKISEKNLLSNVQCLF
jgi:hypothetical protein